jgi:hypothetical protein
VLFPTKSDFVSVLAGHHLQPQRQIVPWAGLVDQPADAMGVLGFVARHDVEFRIPQVESLGNRSLQSMVFVYVVSVGDIERVGFDTPGAFGALCGPF